MMLSSFRKNLRETESGQALVLGAVILLVLAVSVMVTMQLGWAIKERLMVQHAADNAAYSTAVVVARSMNFIAWTNRAIVSQYVSAMAFQAITSYLDAAFMIWGFIYAFVQNMTFTVNLLQKLAAVLSFIPPLAAVNAILTPIASVLRSISKAMKKVEDKIVEFRLGKNKDGDSYFKKILDKPLADFTTLILGKLNKAYYQFQKINRAAVTATLGFSLTDSGLITGVAQETSGGGKTETVFQTGILALNKTSFNSLFDDDAENEKKDSLNKSRAQALMAEIVNASRVGRSSTQRWESRRRFGIPALLEKIAGENASGLTELASAIGGAVDKIFPNSEGGSLLVPYMSEKRFRKIDGGQRNSIFGRVGAEDGSYGGANGFGTNEFGHSFYVPTAMASAEYVKSIANGLPKIFKTLLKFLGMTQDDVIVGIQAHGCKTNNSGKCVSPSDFQLHCHYTGFNGSKTGVSDDSSLDSEISIPEESDISADDVKDKIKDALTELSNGVFGATPGKAQSACDKEMFHSFSGITPYSTFDIKRYADKKQYPSFYSYVSKKPEYPIPELGFKQDQKVSAIGDTGWNGIRDAQNETYDDTYNLSQAPKFWTFSRAQVYYHRPGAWAEPPNLFNPFWKAKLSPKAAAGNEFMSKITGSIGGSLGNSLGEIFYL